MEEINNQGNSQTCIGTQGNKSGPCAAFKQWPQRRTQNQHVFPASMAFAGLSSRGMPMRIGGLAPGSPSRLRRMRHPLALGLPSSLSTPDCCQMAEMLYLGPSTELAQAKEFISLKSNHRKRRDRNDQRPELKLCPPYLSCPHSACQPHSSQMASSTWFDTW